MKNARVLAAAMAISALTLAGCGSTPRQNAATAGGALVGGVVGNSTVGGTLGTLGGAAAGAYIGHEATK